MSAPNGVSRVSAYPWLSALLERGYAVRNSILGDLKFQRLASAIPLTRWVAQRRARDVFDLCAGFVYSQILFACVKLDLFEKLRTGPQSLQQLAATLALPVEAARRLLDAAVALKLVDKLAGDRYGLGPHGAVIAGNPGIIKMVEHHAMLYADLADPVALLRGERKSTALIDYWAYAKAEQPRDASDERISQYTSLMSASQTLIAEEIIAAYPMGGHRRVLDIGGGDGTFLRAVGARFPNLQLTLFDLPAVAARAQLQFEAQGQSDRTSTIGGDFFRDSLPRGHDLVSLVRIIHDHDDEPVRVLFSNVREALSEGGRLIIAEPMSEPGPAQAVGDAYFGFYLMAMGSGRPRSPATIMSMLRSEGYVNVRQVKTRMPLQTGLIIADVQ